MEPKTQVEIQLGHMCNNRCVFCVSGQQTALGRAKPLPVQPLLDNLDQAFAKGHRKLTLLGGEPTLQPGFKAVVSHAVKLGFEEVVIFTNGVKTARSAFLDEIIALGPPRAARQGRYFTWRISIQGATKLSHENTTRKDGSFQRILRTMETLRARGERITVNMCVVGSNYQSVAEFPALIERYAVEQLHLDMVRPMDSGERTEAEFRDMMPSYRAMVAPLTRLVEGIKPGFDFNIGNLPYCFAPHLARWIHHDGEETETIAVDGEQDLSRPWNKYFVKRRDKFKPPSCEGCVFAPRCSGVFQKYTQLHGSAEIAAVTPEALRQVDPGLEVFWAHMTPVAARLCATDVSGLGALPIKQAPADAPRAALIDAGSQVWLHGDRELRVRLVFPQSKNVDGSAAQAQAHELLLALREPGLGVASTDLFSLHLLQALPSMQQTERAIALIWAAISAPQRVWHPPGADALAAGVTRLLSARLQRLRASAPFEHITWSRLEVIGGSRGLLRLSAADGGEAELWLDEAAGRPTGGYRLISAVTASLRLGLSEIMACLRGVSPAAEQARAV